MSLQIIYSMEKEDLAQYNQQWLICHKTQPNPTKPDHIDLKIKICIFLVNTHAITRTDTHIHTHAHLHTYIHKYIHTYRIVQRIIILVL